MRVPADASRLADLSNTASVSSTTSDPDTTNNSANEATTVAPSADVSITLSDSPDPVTPRSFPTRRSSDLNAGPSFARSVQATDPVPAGTSFVSADSGGLNVAGSVTWNLGDLAPGTTRREVAAQVDAGHTADLLSPPLEIENT